MVLITNLTLTLVGHNSQMKPKTGAESRPLVLVRAEEAALTNRSSLTRGLTQHQAASQSQGLWMVGQGAR